MLQTVLFYITNVIIRCSVGLTEPPMEKVPIKCPGASKPVFLLRPNLWLTLAVGKRCPSGEL